METLQQRLADILPAPHPRGLKAEIARHCKVSPPSVTAWFSDPDKVGALSRRHAEVICTLFRPDISPTWLAEGVGPKLRVDSEGAHPQLVDLRSEERRQASRAEIGRGLRMLIDAGKRKEGQIDVPLLHISASMGPGEDQPTDEAIAGTITIASDWAATHLAGAKAEHLRVIHGHGDSMAPTFNSGDVLLVDASINVVKVDGIYVLSAHNRLFIKRVRQRMDGSFEISSDNPAHKTVDVLNGDENVTIHGRVVWAWNGKKV